MLKFCCTFCSQKSRLVEAKLAEAEQLQSQAQEQIAAANARIQAVEEEREKLQADEAARKHRFGFLQSTFAKEKATLQERLDSSIAELTTHQQASSALQEVPKSAA